MDIQEFFHSQTSTLTYILYDSTTRDGIIIDPAFDYDLDHYKVGLDPANQLISFINKHNLNIHFILETHIHADHLTSARYLKGYFPRAQVCISHNILKVQRLIQSDPKIGCNFNTDGSQFDRLLKDHEELKAGCLNITALDTPGHTPACTSFLYEDSVFTGDALFMPDFGTGRCDFPGGSAEMLYKSIHERLYKLPEETKVFVGHDYQPGGRKLAFESTISEEKRSNIHLKESTSKEEFVVFRKTRDAQLTGPKLFYPSLRANIIGGILP